MALSIQEENARLTVDGKSWDDVSTDSGDGMTIDQITIAEIEAITGIDLPDIGDDTHIIVGYEDGDPVIYIDDDIHDEPFDLDDLDLDDLDLDWELDTDIFIDGIDISVNENLEIQKDDLPDHIDIITLPKKLIYYDGQTIDITGMRVVPKREDGSTWTNAKYFRGYIPLQELIIEPLKADKEQASGDSFTSDLDTEPAYPQPVLAYDDGDFWYDTQYYHVVYSLSSSNNVKFMPVYFVDYYGKTVISCVAVGKEGWIWHRHVSLVPKDDVSPYESDEDFTLISSGPNVRVWGNYDDGEMKWVYYQLTSNGADFFEGGNREPNPGSGGQSWIPNKTNEAAWTVVYGVSVEGTQTITVKWKRYGDGEELSNSFEIEVREMSNGGGGR